MEPVMEKSLRQCIQDLEALKTAYNCIDVEDPCTRCLCMAGIMLAVGTEVFEL